MQNTVKVTVFESKKRTNCIIYSEKKNYIPTIPYVTLQLLFFFCWNNYISS